MNYMIFLNFTPITIIPTIPAIEAKLNKNVAPLLSDMLIDKSISLGLDLLYRVP